MINAEKVAKHIADKGKKDLNKDKIKEIIGKGGEKKEKDEEIFNCVKCSEKLNKIGKYWRCESCDYYCSGCGALIEEEDERCPECNAKFED